MQQIEQNEQPIGPELPPEHQEETLPGEVKPFEIVNGFPMYQEGHIIDKRYMIFERIGWDDKVGATYLALGPDNKELVLRLGNDEKPVAKMEAAFLCKVEQENQWRLFSQVHSITDWDNYYFLALYFRGGPTLQQCFDFSNKKFSHGSGGRLAEDVLQILRLIHEFGYSARSLSLDAFHFDASSRHLFMADISDLRKRIGQNGESLPVNWVGGPVFAPLVTHSDKYDEHGITPRDEVESWFYLFLHLVHGLPWDGLHLDDIKWCKIAKDEFDAILNELPVQYRTIHNIILSASGDMNKEDYDMIQQLVKEIYSKVGGISDHDDNFDFEREPTEEELPRFVMERIPEENEETAESNEKPEEPSQ